MKISICIGIVLDFIKKGTLTSREIADKYEISTRTAHRYLNDISLYFPIYAKQGRNGGYVLMEYERKQLLKR
jgi:predicted DNA-binding transcriptional regulator YafY